MRDLKVSPVKSANKEKKVRFIISLIIKICMQITTIHLNSTGEPGSFAENILNQGPQGPEGQKGDIGDTGLAGLDGYPVS